MTQSLPSAFRLIHLDLARETGHPEGSLRDGYVLVLPLKDDGLIDDPLFHAHPEACRVGRIADGETEMSGVVRRERGGQWVFDYDGETETPFRLSEQCFWPGEYFSVRRDGKDHTYRVIALQPIPAGSKLLATS